MEKAQEKIKNIIFDLGGVLLNIDYDKTVEAFRALGMADPEQAFSKEVQAGFFQEFEKGFISETVFVSEINKEFKDASPQEIMDAWCALLGDFPNQRFEYLKKLSKSYRLFLLSNTNIIHLKAFEKIIDKAIGWNNFLLLFEGIGYSHELNMRKPNADIFMKMMDKYNLQPAETCFIDDTDVHVATANSLGITAFHLTNGKEIWDILEGF
ncbi:HAD family phosphatase [Cryomorpha ignava]|uniref:HAD family phosphatase n=1 Tax=Cryomorpha ignava TaxID=101383 RepID=A0A7K3WTB5_9FLAO|nr:HAD family phosphatase [Cryomorpha ignava]NEN24788.1 HAD family phosphatase [Cryomorpha ignava]